MKKSMPISEETMVECSYPFEESFETTFVRWKSIILTPQKLLNEGCRHPLDSKSDVNSLDQ